MPSNRAPFLAGGGCRNIEAARAVPESFSVTIDADFEHETEEGVERTVVTGTHTSERATWLQDEDDLTDNHFGLGRDECEPSCGAIAIQAKDAETEFPAPISPLIVATYLGESDCTLTFTPVTGPDQIENGKIRLWLFVVDAGVPNNIGFGATVTVNLSGGTISSEFIVASKLTWAELVSESPIVIELDPPFFGDTGSVTWTFSAG